MQKVIKNPSLEQARAVPAPFGGTGGAIRTVVLSESRHLAGEADLDCASRATAPLQPAVRG